MSLMLILGIIIIILLLIVIALQCVFFFKRQLPDNSPVNKEDCLLPSPDCLPLRAAYTTASDLLNPSLWRLYIGRVAYTSPAASTGLVNKDFYWDKDNLNLPLLESLMSPNGFFNGLWFQDPTNGIQNYLVGATNADILVTNNLADQIEIKVMKFQNNKAAIQAGAPQYGIATIRLESVMTIDNGIIVFDALQIPSGCGAWPAFWLVGTPDKDVWKRGGINAGSAFDGRWPAYGEIDIIEQINNVLNENHFTLHTSSGCTSDMKVTSGTTGNPDCNTNNGNEGCSIQITGDNMKKGVYICRIDDTSAAKIISLWFFTRDPIGSKCYVNPASLGNPIAKHTLDYTKCPKSHFQSMRLIINLAVCGDWAGSQPCNGANISYDTTSSTCADAYATLLENKDIHVNDPDNPLFVNLKWIIDSIRIFTNER